MGGRVGGGVGGGGVGVRVVGLGVGVVRGSGGRSSTRSEWSWAWACAQDTRPLQATPHPQPSPPPSPYNPKVGLLGGRPASRGQALRVAADPDRTLRCVAPGRQLAGTALLRYDTYPTSTAAAAPLLLLLLLLHCSYCSYCSYCYCYCCCCCYYYYPHDSTGPLHLPLYLTPQDPYIYHYTFGVEYNPDGTPVVGGKGAWSLDKRNYYGQARDPAPALPPP